jgi:phosphoribosylformylglycinamidine synthase
VLIDLGRGQDRLGGSCLAQVYRHDRRRAAGPGRSRRCCGALFAAIQQLNAGGLLLAYHDRSDGGLLTTLARWPSPGAAGR